LFALRQCLPKGGYQDGEYLSNAFQADTSKAAAHFFQLTITLELTAASIAVLYVPSGGLCHESPYSMARLNFINRGGIAMEEQQVEQVPGQMFEKEDIEKNKAMAILAYIIFLIPLLAAKESKFAMYHANQGLVLFLAALAVNVVGGIVPFIGWFIILPLGNLFIVVLAILGIVNAAKGEAKPLPLIGGFKIIS
jgi:uncharacterized membrane protein